LTGTPAARLDRTPVRIGRGSACGYRLAAWIKKDRTNIWSGEAGISDLISRSDRSFCIGDAD